MSVKSLAAKVAFFTWLTVIAVLSVVRPDPDGDIRFALTTTGFVKHIAAYFLAMLLGYLAYRVHRPSQIFSLSALVGLYGLAFEIVQLILIYRTFNPLDIVANLIGVMLFVPIWSGMRYIRRHGVL